MILENLAEKNPAAKNGDTPFHYAAKNGHLDICKAICKLIQNKNPANLDGNTPLHFAAANGHLEICKYLIENGGNKYLENQKGFTPYYLARRHPINYFKPGVGLVCKFLDPIGFLFDIILLVFFAALIFTFFGALFILISI